MTGSGLDQASAALEPAARNFAEATALPPYLFELGPAEGRAVVEEIQARNTAKPAVDIHDLVIPGGPSGEVAVRILRPPQVTASLPVIVYLHGAGWVFGSRHTHDRLLRELAVGAHAAVVFPDYSLSPEAKYPTAIEECYAVASWAAKHGVRHGLDPGRMAVAGDGAGGNLAIAVALLAAERPGVSFSGGVASAVTTALLASALVRVAGTTLPSSVAYSHAWRFATVIAISGVLATAVGAVGAKWRRGARAATAASENGNRIAGSRRLSSR